MIIKKLELKNFQVIRDFSADFEGNVYLIKGENELGKSTILKALGALLTGDRDEVLTAGEKKGYAKAIVGGDGEEYEVSLSFTEANPRGTLTIKSQSGMQSNNVSMLQKIFAYQDFDAVEFSRWSETAEGRRKQVEVVKRLLPTEVIAKIEKIDSDCEAMRNDRTEKNREIKRLEGVVSEEGKEFKGVDAESMQPLSAEDIKAKLAERNQLDAKAESIRTTYKQRKEQLAAIPDRRAAAEQERQKALCEISLRKDEIEKQYQMALKELEIKTKDAESDFFERSRQIDADEQDVKTRIANCEGWLAKYEETVKDEDLNTRLSDILEHNSKCERAKKFREDSLTLNSLRDAVSQIGSDLADMGAAKQHLIDESNLPIKGLTFEDGGLVLNGIPFTPGKVSDSQIMEVAAQLIIASNPKVKVFRIGRGESLGAKRLAAIVDMAKKNGFQGFLECVVRGQQDLSVDEYTEAE